MDDIFAYIDPAREQFIGGPASREHASIPTVTTVRSPVGPQHGLRFIGRIK